MDGPDLAPATRRSRGGAPDAVAEHLSPIVGDDLAARLEAIERSIVQLRHDVANGFQEMASRSVVLAESTDEILTRHADALQRLETSVQSLPEQLSPPDLTSIEGALQRIENIAPPDLSSIASALQQLEATLRSLPENISPPDLASIEGAMRSLADGLITPIEAAVSATIALRSEVIGVLARIEETDVSSMSAQLDLVAERLSTLLGGPSLTEIMDRLDEIGDRRKR